MLMGTSVMDDLERGHIMAHQCLMIVALSMDSVGAYCVAAVGIHGTG